MLKEIKTKIEHCFVDENNLRQGECKRYWSNGRLMDHSFFVNDNLHGKYDDYHSNGQLWEHSSYQNGKRHGECKEYYDNGQLGVHAFYLNGDRHGEYHRYDTNDNLIRSTFFYQGTDLDIDPSTLTAKDKAYILLSGRLPPRD